MNKTCSKTNPGSDSNFMSDIFFIFFLISINKQIISQNPFNNFVLTNKCHGRDYCLKGDKTWEPIKVTIQNIWRTIWAMEQENEHKAAGSKNDHQPFKDVEGLYFS